MITLNFIHLLIIGTSVLGIVAAVMVKWPKLESLDKLKASELAAQLLQKPIPLPTMYTTNQGGERRRVVAWEVAVDQIQNEARLFGAALQYLHAEGRFIHTTESREVEALSREAVLWWHGLTEDDVPADV